MNTFDPVSKGPFSCVFKQTLRNTVLLSADESKQALAEELNVELKGAWDERFKNVQRCSASVRFNVTQFLTTSQNALLPKKIT